MEERQEEQLLDRVREIVSSIFDVPLDQVTTESSVETIERWDSLGRLVLTVELEQEFGVVLAPEDAEGLTSVGSIAAWLATHERVAGGSAWAQ
jgi:acyl carrier protein